MLLLCAFLVGLVAGLRTMLAPAIVSWAAYLRLLPVMATPLAFMGYKYTPLILTVLAVGELISDQLPITPSRKTPPQFAARVASGALVGATIGAAAQMLAAGLVLGVLGAICGTLGGAAARSKLALAFHRDLPAALLEDIAGVAIAVAAVVGLR